MLWRSPACQTAINHSSAEQGPQPGRRYRCHICRLELALDETINRLDVAPLETVDGEPRPTSGHSARSHFLTRSHSANVRGTSALRYRSICSH